MGGGSSGPKYMDEIKISSNESLVKNPETFDNKYIINYKYFYILILIILLFLFLLYKKRYKE